MNLTNLQTMIVNKAYRKAKKKSWFSGCVCLEEFKRDGELSSDNFIKDIGVDNAVKLVLYSTAYWDSPLYLY